MKTGVIKPMAGLSKLQYFQQHQFKIELGLVLAFFFINGTVLATSMVMEAKRHGEWLPFSLWEPFVWEYSSAVGTMALLPGLAWLLTAVPFDVLHIRRSVAIYALASVLFSGLHVGIMVMLRKGIYWIQGGYYDFGHVWFELFYEYRKDLWSFVFLLGIIQAYRFIVSRLQGEASLIQEGEAEIEPLSGHQKVQGDYNNLNMAEFGVMERQETSGQFRAEARSPVYSQVPSQDHSKVQANIAAPTIDRFLVKKFGKEFLIKIDDVEWFESSGNYVNMHVKDRIYPYRSTLGKLVELTEPRGFCRIHRSYAVRLDAIESIVPLRSGDSEVTLLSGKKLTISRRYKAAFRDQL